MRLPGRSRTMGGLFLLLLTSLGLGSLLSYTRSLLVTEIFIDGTDEFIEISTDVGETFSGTVYLSGAKSSLVPLVLDLGSNQSAIFSDKDILFTPDIAVSPGYGRSFTDSAAISRLLLDSSGTILDTIMIDTSTVLAADNTKSSLTRVESERHVTTASGSIGMVDGYYGSPMYWGQHLIDALTQTGSSGTGEEITCIDPSPRRISEVFLGSDEMSAFVELKAQEIIADPFIVFTGDLLSGLVIDVSGQRYPEDHLLIARGHTGVISADIDMLIPSGYQLGTGFMTISGQSGQVLDRVSVSHVISGSQNFGGQGCGRDFDSTGLSTPGYPESISFYFTPVITTPPEECPIPPSHPTLTLDGVRPAPPSGLDETIALTLHTDELIDLDHYYLLKNGGSKRYLYGPTLSSSGTILLTGNFALSNTSDTCVELWSDEDILLDYLCYVADQAADGVRIGAGDIPWSVDDTGGGTGTGEESGSSFSGSVTIDALVYDPPGSDTDAEQITITNLSNQTFDPEELWILIGDAKTKRYIRETIVPGATVTATASFSLPNSVSTCVELHRSGGLLNTKCYTITTSATKTITDDQSASGKAADIEIIDLVYDPPGSDTDHESITFALSDDQPETDLSDYRLLVGTTRKKLEGILSPGEEFTITKTRGFVNTRASCATLLYGEKPVSYRCWAPGDMQTVTGEKLSGSIITSLHILDVIYDPDGNDTGREQLHLAYTGTETLDLSDTYLLINGRKKLLDGSIKNGSDRRIMDNFRFPNTKETCVQIRSDAIMRDEYCYDPSQPKLLETGIPTITTGQGTITAAYPNPPGADGDRERINASIDAHADDGLRSLQIGDRTTRTDPQFDITTQTLRRQGALSLPNRVGCLRLLHADELVDTFCYFSTDDGQTITTDQEDRHDLSSDAVSLLNRLTITSQGTGSDKQFCLRSDGVSLVCKKAPASRSTTTPPERFYRDYISSLHTYLARNRSPIYYDTDVAQHVDLYYTMRDAFRDGESQVTIHNTSYDIDTPMEDLRVAQQQTSYYDIFIDSVVRPLANSAQNQ